jgi:hypothetical protein
VLILADFDVLNKYGSGNIWFDVFSTGHQGAAAGSSSSSLTTITGFSFFKNFLWLQA